MSGRALGLIEYLLVIGLVLGLSILELVSLVRSQRRERRIRKGSIQRTQGD